MRCGDCKHYRDTRNPKTGRPLPSQDGICAYPVEWPTLPKAFMPNAWEGYGSVRRVQYPDRRPMRRDNEQPCECFEACPAKKNAAAQIPLIDTKATP